MDRKYLALLEIIVSIIILIIIIIPVSICQNDLQLNSYDLNWDAVGVLSNIILVGALVIINYRYIKLGGEQIEQMKKQTENMKIQIEQVNAQIKQVNQQIKISKKPAYREEMERLIIPLKSIFLDDPRYKLGTGEEQESDLNNLMEKVEAYLHGNIEPVMHLAKGNLYKTINELVIYFNNLDITLDDSGDIFIDKYRKLSAAVDERYNELINKG